MFIDNTRLYRQIVFIMNLLNIFKNYERIQGIGNKVDVHFSVLKKALQIYISGINNSIGLEANCLLVNTHIIIIGNNSTILFKSGVVVSENAKFCIEESNVDITIGEKITIGGAKFYKGESDTSIFIDNDCMFSSDIAMNTSDFHSIISLEDNLRISPPKSIKINNNVWIGNGAYISKGTVIGSNSVVAASA